MTFLADALGALRDAGGSELLVRANTPVFYRVANRLVRAPLPSPSDEDLERLIKTVAPADKRTEFHRAGEAMTQYRDPQGRRFRVCLFRQRGTPAAVLRPMPGAPPRLEDLGIPEAFGALHRVPRGLVLLAGQRGSGRTTTLSATLRDLVQAGPRRILTLENPVELLPPEGPALVSQREVGRDAATFAAALRAARHQDPDVVLVDDAPDSETIDLVLGLAASGPLVYLVVTAGSTSAALEAVVGHFPVDRRGPLLERLSSCLRGVLAQHLLATTDGKTRTPVFELLLGSSDVREAIRADRLRQLPAILEKTRGCVPLRQSVGLKLRQKQIPLEEAQRIFPSLRG